MTTRYLYPAGCVGDGAQRAAVPEGTMASSYLPRHRSPGVDTDRDTGPRRHSHQLYLPEQLARVNAVDADVEIPTQPRYHRHRQLDAFGAERQRSGVDNGVGTERVVPEMQVPVLDVEKVPTLRIAMGDKDTGVTFAVTVEFDRDVEVAEPDQLG